MKEKKEEPIYNGSDVDFPIAVGMICHSCIGNMEKFKKLVPTYSKEFVQEILDRSKSASLIPNIEQRQSHSVSLNSVVSTNAGICADNFLTLVVYIRKVFKSGHAGMKKMAGGTYYETARKTWADAETMNSMMIAFIDTYNADLLAAGMPAEFPQKCADDSKTFSDSLEAYESYKGIAEQQCQQKVNANNGVYASVADIMLDGKHIFRNDAATRKQFTWSAVLAKVTKNRRSGFTIKVNAPEEGKIVTNAELRLDEEKDLFTANAKGIITAKVPEGTWKGVITAPGFAPLAVTFTSDKGVTHREEVTLAVAIANAG